MLDSINIQWSDLFWPSTVLIIGFGLYYILQKFFSLSKDKNTNIVLQRQLTNIVFILLLIIIFVIALPIKDSLKNQIIGLIGIVLSASIALSSATFLGNIMAGIWLRSVRNFRVGDFIEVKNMFGRVSGRGLLHTELQDIDRDLVTLPNLFLATNPVIVMHNDGTIISTQISLGYDIDHSVIEPILLQAASNAELDKPFVYIESLGDYSISYKVHGLAQDIGTPLSARSKLNRCVLDALHKAKIEIVSPTFMNQRQIGDQTFIPTSPPSPSNNTKEQQHEVPEDVIFDKADKAEKLDEMKQQHKELLERLKQSKEAIKASDDDATKAKLEASYEKLETREQQMRQFLESKSEEVSREGKNDSE